jgi:hypothetical protein
VIDFTKWVCHFHVGRQGTPLTVYTDGKGTYELWHGLRKHVGLTLVEAEQILGRIMMKTTRVSR